MHLKLEICIGGHHEHSRGLLQLGKISLHHQPASSKTGVGACYLHISSAWPYNRVLEAPHQFSVLPNSPLTCDAVVVY